MGTVGQLAARVAQARGADVVVIDPHPARRDCRAPNRRPPEMMRRPLPIVVQAAGHPRRADSMTYVALGGHIALLRS